MPRFISFLMLIATVSIPAFGQSELPQTESELRSEYQALQQDAKAGRVRRVAGLSMLAGGLGLGVFSFWAKEESYVVSCAGAVSPAGCQSATERTVSAPILAAGLSVAMTGGIIGWRGSAKETAAKRRLQQLDDLRRQRGWSLALTPSRRGPALAVSYRW